MIIDRIKGILIGCAYGDAMGMPTENMTREAILERYTNGITEFLPSMETGVMGRNLVAGEITDDTINTIILLETLVKNKGKPNAEVYMQELRRWMEEHPELNEVIVGRSTRRAIEAISRGESMSSTGIWGTTNGASMKISPIGMISDYHQMDDLVNNVYEICYPTHNSQIAIQGASVIAALVSYAGQGGELTGIWDVAIQAIEAAADKGFKRGGAKLKKRIEAVKYDTESKLEEEVIDLLVDFYGTGVETLETIPAVLAILQLTDGDLVRTGQMAASLGGDTDTIGAIAGAIAGAMHPDVLEEIVNRLEKVNHLDFTCLAEKIFPYTVK